MVVAVPAMTCPAKTAVGKATAGQHVDVGELQQRGEDEEETGGHPHIQSLDIGHTGQRGPGPISIIITV